MRSVSFSKGQAHVICNCGEQFTCAPIGIVEHECGSEFDFDTAYVERRVEIVECETCGVKLVWPGQVRIEYGAVDGDLILGNTHFGDTVLYLCSDRCDYVMRRKTGEYISDADWNRVVGSVA